MSGTQRNHGPGLESKSRVNMETRGVTSLAEGLEMHWNGMDMDWDGNEGAQCKGERLEESEKQPDGFKMQRNGLGE